MIDFEHEKLYETKILKKKVIKHNVHQDKFRIPKFESSCVSNILSEDKLILYFGLSNGYILSIILSRQKSIFYNTEDNIILYKSPPKEKHNECSISALLLIPIHDKLNLISAGTDGCIKMWTGQPELAEKGMIHYIDTIFQDRSTVIELIFFKKKNLIIGIFSDIKIRVLAMEDYLDEKKNIRIKLVASSIIEFNVKINPNKEKQYLLTTMSLKDSDITELYVGDNKGNILIYHFVDDNYLKYQSSSSSPDKLILKTEPNYDKNKFNFIEKINLHKKFGVIKVVHSIYDSIIYSSGYDNHIIGYNTKNKQKIFDFLNSNTKTHITDMYLSKLGTELILGDDNGNLTFIDILNKTEFKYKPIKEKLFSIKPIKLFSKQEHLFLLYENFALVTKIIRKQKVAITRHHDAEIMKIFATEPVLYDNTIVEDSKVISIGYDKKIKIWDFLTMECVNEINGPELPKISVTISSARYLEDSHLIALGTEGGRMFFWDIINSEYLPVNYEEKYIHKNVVTDIISFIKKTKEENITIECMLSCSIDGLIMFWEINKIEIKENKKKNAFDYEKSDEFIMNEIKKRDKNSKDKQELDLNKYLQKQKRKELILYKCSPSIKKCINTQKLIKNELKFNVLAFQDKNNFMTIFSGANDNSIYLWDYIKEKYITKIKGSNSFITCMILDNKKNYLFSGGIDGVIDIWNIIAKKSEKEVSLSLIHTINDPDITKNFLPRINDLLILPRINILVFSNNNKKIYLYDINIKQITGKIKSDNDTISLSCLESYGKLLCGTREKMIIEINLNEELKKAGYKEIYDKYSFIKNKANYEKNELDKYINNFLVMKSITTKDDLFDTNEDKK